MTELHLPWLELGIFIPLIGAVATSRLTDPRQARLWALAFSGAALFFTAGAWLDLDWLHVFQADDRWHLMSRVLGREVFVVDELSAPVLPLTALLYFLTMLTTQRTKLKRFSFGLTLVSESLTLAAFSCQEPWFVIGLLSAATIPPYLELRERRQSTRMYVGYMALFVGLMVGGWSVAAREPTGEVHTLWAIVPLLAAVFVRSGIAPFHGWLPDLFERASFGAALLYSTPIAGAYAAVRLVLPIAPDWVLRSIGGLSLLTAVYASGMALVQRDARRFFCYLLLSHSALVLVGLEMATPLGLTGALCVWLSIGLSLTGFGLTLRALEARQGRLSLTTFQGLYEHTPMLAVGFILTGLASIGFPGTVGFIGTELLVDGAVEVYPHIGIAVVVAGAMNGIALVQAYFRLFTGTRHAATVPLALGRREWYSVALLTVLIVCGGLFPQPGVASRYHAAHELLHARAVAKLGTEEPLESEQFDEPAAASQSPGGVNSTAASR